MSTRINNRLAGGLVVGLFTIGFAAQVHATPVSSTPTACTVSVSGDSLQVRAEPITVDVATTDAIGDSVSASFPIESKIVVSRVASATVPKTVRLTINTSAAAPGNWMLSLKGSQGVCTGTVKVTPAADK